MTNVLLALILLVLVLDWIEHTRRLDGLKWRLRHMRWRLRHLRRR